MIKKIFLQQAINFGKHLPTAIFANLKHNFPSKEMLVVGVTGTDGKTTTVNMITHILRESGRKVAMVSTVKAQIGEEEIDTGAHITNPSAVLLQGYIKKAREIGTEVLVLEVTSHGLDQFRTWGIKFDIGVITNITHEHLDYHRSFDNYFKTKAKLIRDVRIAVLNKDEKHFAKLATMTNGKIISFGFSSTADLNLKKFPIELGVPGDFNLLNGLAAAVVCKCIGVSEDDIKKTLLSFEGVKGRMDQIKNKKRLKIIIDFAHTPNALEKALRSMRLLSKGKIISLIGAEGKRDVLKRAMMGEVASRLSDSVVITSVDPRGEVDKINEDIIKGCLRGGGVLGKNVFIENDRQKAIDLAILKLAKPLDIVGIFGKGHENTMNLNGKDELPWSDYEAVQKSLNG